MKSELINSGLMVVAIGVSCYVCMWVLAGF